MSAIPLASARPWARLAAVPWLLGALTIGGLVLRLVAIDSRSFVSNQQIAERIEAELAGFELERLDYTDRNGVAKRALVAHRGDLARHGGHALG